MSQITEANDVDSVLSLLSGMRGAVRIRVHGEHEQVVIDPALVSQIAETAPDRPPGGVRFTGYEAISAQAAQTWKSSYAYGTLPSRTLHNEPASPARAAAIASPRPYESVLLSHAKAKLG